MATATFPAFLKKRKIIKIKEKGKEKKENSFENIPVVFSRNDGKKMFLFKKNFK